MGKDLEIGIKKISTGGSCAQVCKFQGWMTFVICLVRRLLGSFLGE